jgi:hypothetical protein
MIQLLRRLDTLGNHLESQAVRQGDDRLNDRRVIGMPT